MPTTPEPTLILGGGMSGLLAAWHLHRAGQRVAVWEASDAVGGWAQTLPWPGPDGEPGWLERGPQGLRLSRTSALNRVIGELALPLHPRQPRGPRWVGREGRRGPSPTTLAGLWRTPGLGLSGLARMLLEPCLPAGLEAAESLHDFIARRLGQPFAQACLPALVAGVLAAPPEQVGVEALPRLRQLEALGGLFLGGWRLGPEATHLAVGGTGALARRLAEQLPWVRLRHRVEGIEALPDGRWRVHHAQGSAEAQRLVLALPAATCADLLRPLAPTAARLLGAIPRLDLRVWHSRHPMVRGWARGLGLLLHPPGNRGLLGVTSLAATDPQGVPGLLQLRAFVGGGYPVAPELEAWPGLFTELRRWLPELSEAVQVRVEHCPAAFPLLAPGHSARIAAILEDLPAGIDWLGPARLGPGLPDLAQGIERWAGTLGP